jgi:hypothetical protein
VGQTITSAVATKASDPGLEPRTQDRHSTPSVLVVFANGRAGAAALREGAERAAAGARLSVVTLAPQAKPLKCCKGGGAGPYNCGVRDAAAEDLLIARNLLGPLAADTAFTTLIGTPEPPLASGCAARSFDEIVLWGSRFARGGGRMARELRRVTDAYVRVIWWPRRRGRPGPGLSAGASSCATSDPSKQRSSADA